jgi:hypothetical protein
MFTKIYFENIKQEGIFGKIIYTRENWVRSHSINFAAEEYVPVTLLCADSDECSGSVKQGICLRTE